MQGNCPIEWGAGENPYYEKAMMMRALEIQSILQVLATRQDILNLEALSSHLMGLV